MNKQSIVTLAILLVIASGMVAYARNGVPLGENQKELRQVVTEFGDKLKDVSVLAPETIAAQSIEDNFGAYISPELLVEWKADPASAPGRLTSSPWPENIEIVSVVKNQDGSYIVAGEVIEMTTTGEAAKYPVTATLKMYDGKWVITDFSGYSDRV